MGDGPTAADVPGGDVTGAFGPRADVRAVTANRARVRLRFLFPMTVALLLAVPMIVGVRVRQEDALMLLGGATLLLTIPMPGLLLGRR